MTISTLTQPSSRSVQRRPGRPIRATKQDQRAALLDAAIQAFALRGFAGASLSQIAKAAGTDTALIRYYYGSKLGLWQAAVDRIGEAMVSELDQLLTHRDGTATATLKLCICWYLDFSARWPQLSRIMIAESGDDNRRAHYIHEAWLTPLHQWFDHLIRRAKSEGKIVDVSPDALFLMIIYATAYPMALPGPSRAFARWDSSEPKALNAHAAMWLKLLFKV